MTQFVKVFSVSLMSTVFVVPLHARDGLKAPPRVRMFDLQDVTLLEGPFKQAREKDQVYVLSLKPDRLLASCRTVAGLVPKDSAYGGWEREGLASHFIGHYLSACALLYRSTGDARFLERVNTVVDELAECQKANGNGFVGGMPDSKRVFAEVAVGNITSRPFKLNGLWSPFYTIHKIMAGLRDACVLCGNIRALAVLRGMSDWVEETTKRLDEDQFQCMLACEYGGMNEVLADVYVLTGDEKYLHLSRKFYHRDVQDPLVRGEDRLDGLHGNTQIPKLIGAARLYEITGESQYADMSRFFWQTVTRHHTYAAGGHGENEHFGAPDRLSDRLSESTMETCNSYNMLKLTRFLFTREPDAAYGDFYERALYNHILASQNPDDGMVCYFVPLGSGTYKTYSTPTEDFTCCLGTGLENHARYNEGIYFHSDESLYVNLSIASELRWKEKGMRLRQTTDFPSSGVTRLELSCEKPVRLALKIRHPFWASTPPLVVLNGKALNVVSHPQSFITVVREWRDGDRIEVTFPRTLRLEPMADAPHRAAIMVGPILLAGDAGAITESANVPVLITNGRPAEEWLQPVGGAPLTFRTRNVGLPGDATLIPFFRMHHRRHVVYWDVLTDEEWGRRKKEIAAERARLEDLEARTVDLMRVGEIQTERERTFQGEKTSLGEYRGRKWRLATDGGWFTFEMNVPPGQNIDLVVTYWGSDAGKREFDITVNGERIATQIIERNRPDQFFDVAYGIPARLLRGRSKVTVGFFAHRGTNAGRVFGCRIVRTVD